MTDNRPARVQFEQVTVRIPDGRPIVSDLTFEVLGSEILVLLGRSGSGKTTTLKLINRLLVPSEGAVRVEGRATTDWIATDLRRRIGYVIQDVGLFPHFTAERNVGLVPTLEGWDPGRIRERARELLSSSASIRWNLRAATPLSSLVVKGSEWAWRAPWPRILPCSSSMSPLARLIR